jgi:hypothetical protein
MHTLQWIEYNPYNTMQRIMHKIYSYIAILLYYPVPVIPYPVLPQILFLLFCHISKPDLIFITLGGLIITIITLGEEEKTCGM